MLSERDYMRASRNTTQQSAYSSAVPTLWTIILVLAACLVAFILYHSLG